MIWSREELFFSLMAQIAQQTTKGMFSLGSTSRGASISKVMEGD